MAAMATVNVEMTPALRDAIDNLVPVVRASEQLWKCQCEFADEPNGMSACSEYQEAWDQAMIDYTRKKETRP